MPKKKLMESITLNKIPAKTALRIEAAFNKHKFENPESDKTKVQFTISYLDTKLKEDEKANEGPF